MLIEWDKLRSTEFTSARGMWAEVLLLCLAVAAIGLYFSPDDPLLTRSDGFSWPLLLPVLFGLRYGFAQALIGSLLLLLLVAVGAPAGSKALPSFSYIVGLLIVSGIAGEFRDGWHRRLGQLNYQSHYARERMEEFTRAYHALKLSHDQLEQQSAGGAGSLRSSLTELQHILFQNECRQSDNPLSFCAQQLFDILKQFSGFKAAALYRVDERRIDTQALVTVGSVSPLDKRDPMITEAMSSGQVVSLRSRLDILDTASHASRYLAAVPFSDFEGEIHALLLIEDLPFFAFHEKNLQMLAILAGRIADIVTSSGQVHHIAGLQSFEFRAQLQRCRDDARRYDIASQLVSFRFADDAIADRILDNLYTAVRSTDAYTLVENTSGQSVILALLPLTDAQQVSYYMQRMNNFFTELCKQPLTSIQVSVDNCEIGAQTSSAQLRDYLSRALELDENTVHELFLADNDEGRP